jgi:hypothetical protein
MSLQNRLCKSSGGPKRHERNKKILQAASQSGLGIYLACSTKDSLVARSALFRRREVAATLTVEGVNQALDSSRVDMSSSIFFKFILDFVFLKSLSWGCRCCACANIDCYELRQNCDVLCFEVNTRKITRMTILQVFSSEKAIIASKNQTNEKQNNNKHNTVRPPLSDPKQKTTTREREQNPNHKSRQ